mmetsp:Transcript_38637/g.65996  ORF Transcript_38637/g.65996 Transcript_38637/m.65996 type:complete len:466 (+) Transcript_38637:106-1503(+)
MPSRDEVKKGDVANDGTTNTPNAAAPAHAEAEAPEAADPRGRVEVIDDDVGPTMRQVELVDDGAGPPEEASAYYGDSNLLKKQRDRPEIIHDQNESGGPDESYSHVSDSITKKILAGKREMESAAANPYNVDDISARLRPINEIQDADSAEENVDEMIRRQVNTNDTNFNMSTVNRIQDDNVHELIPRQVHNNDVNFNRSRALGNNFNIVASYEISTNPGMDQEEENEPISILEAYPVPDHIAEAEPLLPWWKQTRTKILFFVVLVCVAVAAVTLGVYLSSDAGTDIIVRTRVIFASSAPSISIMPSLSPSKNPTMSPSSSAVPTLHPITLLEGQNRNRKVAWNKHNMVMVTRDSGSLYITFYARTEENGNAPVDVFNEKDYGNYAYDIALDENRFAIEFHKDCCGYGSRIIYEQEIDSSGVLSWQKTIDGRCRVKCGNGSGRMFKVHHGVAAIVIVITIAFSFI